MLMCDKTSGGITLPEVLFVMVFETTVVTQIFSL